METGNVTAAARGAYASQTKAPAPSGSDLSINDFFRLIAAQLENQSMYDTVDNTQFLSQLAQFTTLNQMNELKASINTNLAVSLLGRPVALSFEGKTGQRETATGTVEKISYENGVPYLYVGGKLHPLEHVSHIG